MHQYDIPILYLAQHGVNGPLRIPVLPVPGINGPHNGRHTHGAQHIEGCRVDISPRRAHKDRRYAADSLDLLVGRAHLAYNSLCTDFSQVFVVMGVVGNLASLVHHALDYACIGVHIGTQHEECCPSSIGLQTVQYPAGHGCLGSVIKCKGNHGPGWVNSMGNHRFRRNPCTLSRDGSPYAVHPETCPLLSGGRAIGRPVCPGAVLKYFIV